jgi:DNA-binding transcriptional MocR family regulator
LCGVAPLRLRARQLRRAAAHDVGIYSTTALHLRRPRCTALLLGHGALSEREIATGIARLADVIVGASRS